MPDNLEHRVSRTERDIEMLVEGARLLVENARLQESRISDHDRQIESLAKQTEAFRQASLETGKRIESLVSAIGDYLRSQNKS